jgi:hypothetical protein
MQWLPTPHNCELHVLGFDFVPAFLQLLLEVGVAFRRPFVVGYMC